ncbi:MAG: hypothetical protein K0R52_256 [Alphaproteobacteria bacterium]|jgi:hypothetical protein|nr:hypothetical protein [Alphaproteobacteria bacterium]
MRNYVSNNETYNKFKGFRKDYLISLPFIHFCLAKMDGT